MTFFFFANWRELTSSLAFEAKGVTWQRPQTPSQDEKRLSGRPQCKTYHGWPHSTRNETKNAGIDVAVENEETASTIGSEKSATSRVPPRRRPPAFCRICPFVKSSPSSCEACPSQAGTPLTDMSGHEATFNVSGAHPVIRRQCLPLRHCHCHCHCPPPAPPYQSRSAPSGALSRYSSACCGKNAQKKGQHRCHTSRPDIKTTFPMQLRPRDADCPIDCLIVCALEPLELSPMFGLVLLELFKPPVYSDLQLLKRDFPVPVLVHFLQQ